MLENKTNIVYLIQMKNPNLDLVSLPINAAHLMSLAGMLRQYASENLHGVFSLQVSFQASQQGLDIYNLESTNYKNLLAKTLNFSIPTAFVAKVGTALMDAHKEASFREPSDKSRNLIAALELLIMEWRPFAIEGMKNIDNMGDRFDDISRESLN